MIAPSRIVSNPKILGGKPIVKGTRISVEFLLELVRSGMATQEILEEYPHLTKADVQAALQFAKTAVSRQRMYSMQDRVAA